MPSTIVECIANYSEARRAPIVEQIKQAILSVPTVNLLDQHSDLDHNRTVLTFCGSPAAVEEAAFRSIAKAAQLINLDEHRGEHPRIGATDVVPFVPIAGVTMQECVEMSRRLGSRVGKELEIPVYLYEEAASRPERKNLEDLRRGQYEGLKAEIQSNPQRAPDFGPSRLGTAGATVIGARHPLIAFNVYLNSGDVEIAKKVAKAIRHSSGGLHYVKGLGLLVDGMAQVSMNLTNYHATPMARTVEMIRREAVRYGVNVHHSELVGLIPQQALVDAARWYLQMDQFEEGQILEYRLAEVQAENAAPEAENFLEALAQGTPTPGGGSAAAFSGAAAAGLVAMVARLTIGKKKYAEVKSQMQAALERAEVLRGLLTSAIQRDAEAFNAVMEAFRLPKTTPEEINRRQTAIELATLQAARVPLEVARWSVEAIELAREVIELGNLNTISDGASGAALGRAALTSAGYNVRTNLISLQELEVAKTMLAEMSELERRAEAEEAQIRRLMAERAGVSLV